MAQRCRTEIASEVTKPRVLGPPSFRILRAYFRKRASSGVVGNLLKDFQIKQLSEERMYVGGVLPLNVPGLTPVTPWQRLE